VLRALLVNVNPADRAKGYPKASQWKTNLIGYDALRSFGSPSYYAQVMLGQNKGDVVLPSTLNVAPVAAATQPASAPMSVFASVTYVTASHTVIVKVVNISENSIDMAINLRGTERVDSSARDRPHRRPRTGEYARSAHEHRSQARQGDRRVGIVSPYVPFLLAHRFASDCDTEVEQNYNFTVDGLSVSR